MGEIRIDAGSQQFDFIRPEELAQAHGAIALKCVYSGIGDCQVFRLVHTRSSPYLDRT
jgi:hypothetical protein